MSPPFPEQAIDRNRAPLSRGGQDFAGVCGRLHFFYCGPHACRPRGEKNAARQEKKMTPGRKLKAER